MQVEIDRELCIGSGNCVHLTGNAIQLDEEDVATLISVDTATLQQFQQAERSCPTGAITVSDGPQ